MPLLTPSCLCVFSLIRSIRDDRRRVELHGRDWSDLLPWLVFKLADRWRENRLISVVVVYLASLSLVGSVSLLLCLRMWLLVLLSVLLSVCPFLSLCLCFWLYLFLSFSDCPRVCCRRCMLCLSPSFSFCVHLCLSLPPCLCVRVYASVPCLCLTSASVCLSLSASLAAFIDLCLYLSESLWTCLCLWLSLPLSLPVSVSLFIYLSIFEATKEFYIKQIVLL